MKVEESALSKLAEIIDIEKAIATFGEPVYGFFRVHVVYSAGRKRGQGQHYVSSDLIPVTEQEYRENIKASNDNELERFFSNPKKRFTKSFWRYEAKVVKPGWPQAIRKLIDEIEKA